MSLDYSVAGDANSPKEQLIDRLHAVASTSSPSLPKFPEIKGLCRTCDNAHIARREYDEMPSIRCAVVSSTVMMPLDIMECTGYRQRGRATLREMAEMAILIDGAKPGGQYL